jgi:hypothetical protein
VAYTQVEFPQKKTQVEMMWVPLNLNKKVFFGLP